MIRINKSLKQLDTMAKKHLAVVNGNGFLKFTTLDANSNDKKRGPLEKSFFKYLYDNVSKIICGQPYSLESMILQLNIHFDNTIGERVSSLGKTTLTRSEKRAQRRKLKNELEGIFDYKGFISAKKGKYAYELAKKLDVSVCLYCNQQFTFTISTKDGKTRPQFDHFFDKGTHPWFRLSFYNLIPSCPTCNSPGVKGTKPFLPSTNVHPFIEDFDGVYDFRININSIDYVEGRKSKFTLKLKGDRKSRKDRRYHRSAANGRIFHLNEIYKNHKGYVADLIKRHYYYESGRYDDLRDFKTSKGNAMFDSEQQAREFVVGIPLSTEMKTKRVLAKLHFDIADQLGTIRLISKSTPI